MLGFSAWSKNFRLFHLHPLSIYLHVFVFRNLFLSPNPPNWKETLFTTACSPAVGILHASLILHEPKDARVAKQRPRGRHSKFFPAWVETGADCPYLSHHQGFFPQLSLSLHGIPFVSFILPTFTMRYPLTLQVPIPALQSRQRRSAVLEAKANCEAFDQCRHPLTSRRKPIESSRRRKATGRRRNPPDDWFQVEQYPFLQDAGGDQPGHRPGPIFQALRRCNLCLPKGQHPPIGPSLRYPIRAPDLRRNTRGKVPALPVPTFRTRNKPPGGVPC